MYLYLWALEPVISPGELTKFKLMRETSGLITIYFFKSIKFLPRVVRNWKNEIHEWALGSGILTELQI